MVEKSAEVFRKLFDRNLVFRPKRARLAVPATIKGEQTNPGRRSEQIKRLVGVGAQAVLENEREALATFAIVETKAVVFKERHLTPTVSRAENARLRERRVPSLRAARSGPENSSPRAY